MAQIDKLAERLDDLETRVNARPPAASHTTIVNGAIDQMETYDTGERDAFGNIIWGTRLVSRIGRQPDGGNTVVTLDGPIPPAPTAPLVTAGPGTISVRWDGAFAGGAAMPSDFYAVLVHVVKSSLLGSITWPSAATLAGSVVAKDGDGLTVGGLTHEQYAVVLVTVSQAGKWSEPSDIAFVTPDDGSSLPVVSQMQADVATAVAAAQDAAALADGKASTYFNTTAPDPALIVLSEGDLWFDTDDGNKLYRYSGTAWVVAQDQSAAQALSAAQAAQSDAADAALDASSALALAGTKITTYAQTAQPPVNTSKSGDLWIDTDDGNRLYRFNGTSWTDVRDSTIVSAQQTASQALTVAGQKGKTYSQGSAPNGSSTPPPVTGDLWWDTTNYVLKQYNGSTWSAPAMDASQNIRSNTITAGLLATQIVLASTLVAGPLNNSHAEISSDGISLYQLTTDGVVRTSRLGSTGGDDFLQVFNRTNSKVVASLDQFGVITASKARLGSTAGDTYINGAPFESYLDPYPRGMIARGERTSSGPAATSETAYLEVQTILQPKRLYRVQVGSSYAIGGAAGAKIMWVLRQATDGQAVVTVTGYQLTSAQTYLPQSGQLFTCPPMQYIVNTGSNTNPREYRFLASYLGTGGTVYPAGSTSYPVILSVEDLGPAMNQVGIDYGQTTPPATKQNYTTYWAASASASYRGDGSRRTDVGGEMIQGWDPSGYNGNGSALCVFGAGAYTSTASGEVGKSVDAALAGATITAVDFHVRNHHWYYNAGGQVVYTPSSYYTSLPSTLQMLYGNRYAEAGFSYGEGRYVPAPAQKYYSLLLGQGSGSNLSYYGRFDGYDGPNQAPVMRVSYTR